MSTDWFSIEIAFSTGMTCMPIPDPPIGTIGVTFSRGRKVILSKNIASSGCLSISSVFMFVYSAEPGTNIGTQYMRSFLSYVVPGTGPSLVYLSP